MPIVLRGARAEDLEESDRLVVSSINHLTSEHGFGAIASASPPLLQRFCLDDDPKGLWVAEDDGDMVGFGLSWMCDDFWFLAQLFVAPDRQQSGLGAKLLQRTLEQAELRRATRKALITFAFNRSSQGLYVRHGLYPDHPLYLVSGSREGTLARLTVKPLVGEPLELTEASLDRLADVDRSVLGFSRRKHHDYMLRTAGLKAVGFRVGTTCVGYAYVSQDGHIGPLAIEDADLFRPAFSAAVLFAAQGNPPTISALLPGINQQALRMALDVGMRITLPLLLMSDGKVGNWDRYCPRNPGIM